jgi:hypothetical protein
MVMHLASVYLIDLCFMVVHLMSAYLIGECLMSMRASYRRLSHGRASHGRVSHRHAPHGHASQRRAKPGAGTNNTLRAVFGAKPSAKSVTDPWVQCIADTNRVASVATGARLVTNCPVSYRVGQLLSIRKITLLGKMARPID